MHIKLSMVFPQFLWGIDFNPCLSSDLTTEFFTFKKFQGPQITSAEECHLLFFNLSSSRKSHLVEDEKAGPP